MVTCPISTLNPRLKPCRTQQNHLGLPTNVLFKLPAMSIFIEIAIHLGNAGDCLKVYHRSQPNNRIIVWFYIPTIHLESGLSYWHREFYFSSCEERADEANTRPITGPPSSPRRLLFPRSINSNTSRKTDNCSCNPCHHSHRRFFFLQSYGVGTGAQALPRSIR